MELKLKRPIVFFDLETTGLDIARDRIVELSYVKVHPDGREQRKCLRFNPGMAIPAASTAVHHITDDDVRNEPTFAQRAREVAEVFKDSDIAGFNSNQFDVPMLVEEMLRAGVEFDITRHKLVDVQTIYHKMEKRDLAAAVLFYTGKPMENHHSATADTEATYEVLKAQLDRYDSLQNDVDFLAEFSTRSHRVDLAGRIVRDEQGREVFNFGQHKGKPVEEVLKTAPGYYEWMMKGDFPENTKQVLTRIKLRMK